MMVHFPAPLCSSSSLSMSESNVIDLVGPGLVIIWGVVCGVVLGGALPFVIWEVSLFGLETLMESFMLIEAVVFRTFS